MCDKHNNEMTALYNELLTQIGEDTTREGLVKTPMRAARSFQHLTSGYTENLQDLVNGALFESDVDDLVIVKNIECYSLCEHHLLPFHGKAHVAYIPNGKIIGLSKIPRIVDMFARRLQTQENLTSQIAHAIEEVTGAKGVGVIIEAKHFCMMMRGVNKQNPSMTTSVQHGLMRSDHRTRHEFLSLLKA